MNDEDEEIVRGLLDGQTWAQKRLVEKFGPGLYFLINSWTRDREHAEDLMSETFVKALNKLACYDPGRGTLCAWLGCLANGIYKSWVEKNGLVWLGLERAEEEQILFGEADRTGYGTVKQRAFSKALSGLTSEEKEVLTLCCPPVRNSEEIAKWLGVSVQTLYQKKHRALKRLKDKMKGMEAFRELFVEGPVHEVPVTLMEESFEKGTELAFKAAV